MSEVIVRMDKFPTKCIDCKMWSICEALNKVMADDQDLFASRLYHKKEEGFTKPADCPIVGALPEQHGDLIDRDALLKECYPDDEFDAHVIYADDIREAKAIIAAERSETNGNAD